MKPSCYISLLILIYDGYASIGFAQSLTYFQVSEQKSLNISWMKNARDFSCRNYMVLFKCFKHFMNKKGL